MKIKLVLSTVLIAALFSCSTVYKSGQTPDDVYYSPARSIEESSIPERTVRRSTDYEEREIRMASYDRRWRSLNYDYQYDYSYNPYRYGYTYGYYYNPYYYPCPVYINNVAISNPKNSTPRMTSLGSYSQTTTSVAPNGKFGNPTRITTVRAYNNSNTNTYSNGSRTSNAIRRIITSPDNSSTNRGTTETSNTRTYTPSSPGSSSSGNSSSSGSVARPARGN